MKINPPFYLQDLTREQAALLFAKGYPVILPLGATEQHGQHLPLGTDTFLAGEFASRVAGEISGIILPAIPLGYSWSWRDIAGTVSLRQDTLMSIIRDVALSLDRFQVKNLIIITGHEANRSAMKYICRDLADELHIRIIYLFYPGFEQVAEQQMDSELWHGIVHAGEFETSLMLATQPELVDMAVASREYPRVPEDFGCSARSVGELSCSGVYGDATAATKEKGEQFWQILVAETRRKLKAILESES